MTESSPAPAGPAPTKRRSKGTKVALGAGAVLLLFLGAFLALALGPPDESAESAAADADPARAAYRECIETCVAGFVDFHSTRSSQPSPARVEELRADCINTGRCRLKPAAK